MDIPRTLIVTNDFPPRVGGVQTFVHSLIRELPPEQVAVLAPAQAGSEEFDAGEAYPVERAATPLLWPTAATFEHVLRSVAGHRAQVVLFGSPVPLAAIGPRLADRGTPYLTLAHGFEYWMSIAPGAHAFLRYTTSRASSVLACSRFVARVVRTAVPAAVPVAALTPGVDPGRFRPGLEPGDLRAELGLGSGPVVVCVSRLVPRKGQDVLIRAMRRIRQQVPDATLVLVGEGRDRRRLDRLAAAAPEGAVVFAGAIPEERLPSAYALGDVFAMPCRDRLGGLEVEGLGIVFVEAAACGLPVVAGDSGGASEALVDGETGLLVDGRDERAVADAVGGLLADPQRAARFGAAGRRRVERELDWARVAERLARHLREASLSGSAGTPG